MSSLNFPDYNAYLSRLEADVRLRYEEMRDMCAKSTGVNEYKRVLEEVKKMQNKLRHQQHVLEHLLSHANPGGVDEFLKDAELVLLDAECLTMLHGQTHRVIAALLFAVDRMNNMRNALLDRHPAWTLKHSIGVEVLKPMDAFPAAHKARAEHMGNEVKALLEQKTKCKRLMEDICNKQGPGSRWYPRR